MVELRENVEEKGDTSVHLLGAFMTRGKPIGKFLAC
jgi:hypothetical protein